jgi:hypothetical protein
MTIFGNNSSSSPKWDLDKSLKQAFSSIQKILPEDVPDAQFNPSFASVFKEYSRVSSLQTDKIEFRRSGETQKSF